MDTNYLSKIQMKSFSFKVLYISLFVPSILFVMTLPVLERVIQDRVVVPIRQQLIHEHAHLLDGSASLYEEITTNIAAVLRRSTAARLGADIKVRVLDANGTVLYPYYDRLLLVMQQGEKGLARTPSPLFDDKGFLRQETDTSLAGLFEKYSDYIQGLRIEVIVAIPATSWLGSLTLLIYIFLVVIGLYLYYQRSSRLEEAGIRDMTAKMRQRLEMEKQEHARQVDAHLQEAQDHLADIKRQEEEWLREVERLEKEKTSLEEELLETLEHSEEQQEKLHLLEEEVAKKQDRQTKAAAKDETAIAERFAKLYRNLELDRGALRGFAQLHDEQTRLAAEEMLKRLNDGDPNLKVRRKIAGVAGVDAFELGFGAQGRIYYLHSNSHHSRVARIGTKATQAKDLAALQGLSP